MTTLLKNVTNAIWHAFDGLHQEQQGLVNKTKLKVLTANIATIFDLYGVEKALESFRSTQVLNFGNFRQYLLQEVFSVLPNNLNMPILKQYEDKIEEICWLICRKKFQNIKNKFLRDIDLYRLFRIFCFLSDFRSSRRNDNLFEVLLHSTEAAQIVHQIMSTLGLDFENDVKLNILTRDDHSLHFHEFVELFSFNGHQSNSMEYEESLHEAIQEIYETYIKDIIKKGYLLRRGYLLPTFKEYWFVLQPHELSYYKNHNQKELCGTIVLDARCVLKPSVSSLSKPDKLLKFILISGERSFELGMYEHRLRMQWMAALELAITYSTGREGFQRDLVSRRRRKREVDTKRKFDEEQLRATHLEEVEHTKTQLEQEKQARLAAESQARELKATVLEDSRRVAELEDMKTNLEQLLEEEIQAKRDEEIVRALQARVLAEEWEKREELEQLQMEQQQLLEHERQKRIEFEQRQKDKENQLKEAEIRLKLVEDERKKLDYELKQARFKIIQSGENKEDLEARMDAICNSGPTIRRAASFVMPSRERNTPLELRAATLRRNVKNIN